MKNLKIDKVITQIILKMPFYACILLQTKIESDDSIPTACTDGETIKYNPEFFKKMTENDIKFILCHEVLHIAHLHFSRMNKRDTMRWNIACDYIINAILLNSKDINGQKIFSSMPEGLLLDDKYKGMGEEQVYNLLPEPTPKQKKQAGKGMVKENNKKKIENKVKITVKNAIASEKMSCGRLSKDLNRLSNKLFEPKINWKNALCEFITQKSKNDYNYNTPNRRYISTGFYMPTLQDETLGNIVIGIDTSGSVSPENIGQFMTEVSDILTQYRGLTATVIYCDYVVKKVKDYSSYDLPINFKGDVKGGGGTLFKPVFDYIKKNDVQCSCLVYFTDLCSTDIIKATKNIDFPVLWVVPEKHHYEKVKTIINKNGLGKIIYIKD